MVEDSNESGSEGIEVDLGDVLAFEGPASDILNFGWMSFSSDDGCVGCRIYAHFLTKSTEEICCDVCCEVKINSRRK